MNHRSGAVASRVIPLPETKLAVPGQHRALPSTGYPCVTRVVGEDFPAVASRTGRRAADEWKVRVLSFGRDRW